MLRSVLRLRNGGRLSIKHVYCLVRTSSVFGRDRLVIKSRSKIANESSSKGVSLNETILKRARSTDSRSTDSRSTDSRSTDSRSTYSRSTDSRLNSIVNVRNAKDLPSLLKFIENDVNKLTSNQLDVIYDRIMVLNLEAKQRSNQIKTRCHINFNQLINQSPVYRSLIKRTSAILSSSNINNSKLEIKVLRTFALTNQHPNSRPVQLILKNLLKQSSRLEMDDLIKILTALPLYLVGTSDVWSFYKQFFQLAESRALDVRFAKNNIETLTNCLDVFIVGDHHRAVAYLIKLLVNKSRQFGYTQAIQVMRKLQQIENLNQFKSITHFESNLKQLIDECNGVIIRELERRPTDRNAWIYLKSMTHAMDSSEINSKNFYNPKVLELITPILIKNPRPEIYYLILDFVHILDRAQIYDERLLRCISEQALKDEKFRTRRCISLIKVLFQYRYPFIDHQSFAKQMLTTNLNQIQNHMQNDKWNLKLICKLIIYDVDDERLIDLIDLILSTPIKKQLYTISSWLNLTKLHLSHVSELEPAFRDRLKSKFMVMCGQVSSSIPSHLRMDLFRINNKLQENAIFNGISLNEIAIFDQSTRDLVPLTNYQDYFHRLHQIPLNKNQELLTFIYRKPLNGHIPPFDTTHKFALLRILDKFKVKTVEVNLSGLKDSPVEKSEYLVAKALKSYE